MTERVPTRRSPSSLAPTHNANLWLVVLPGDGMTGSLTSTSLHLMKSPLMPLLLSFPAALLFLPAVFRHSFKLSRPDCVDGVRLEELLVLRSTNTDLRLIFAPRSFSSRFGLTGLAPSPLLVSFSLRRVHLQSGASLSSSVTSSSARRVRQLPQLPPKSNSAEQGEKKRLAVLVILTPDTPTD